LKQNKFYTHSFENYIQVKSKYLTNFKISNSINYKNPEYQFIKNKINKNYKNKKMGINKKILINYLFTFLYFLINKIKVNNFKLNVNILPKKNNRFIMLSAPVRHKLPKHTLGFSRYYFSLTFLITLPSKYFKITQKTNFTNLHKNLFEFIKLYESNIYFNEKTLINLPVKLNESFKLKNFIH
jgi:hypothetical protein